MSLYTPVFPSLVGSNTSRNGNTVALPGKQQSYVEFLRNVHLSLSTQKDMLSPPSRPSSPLFEHRVQQVRDKIQNIMNATEGEASGGEWTRVSQTLKLGCARGRHWSVSGAATSAPKENDTNWMLPEEESEWIEWEKKREESRRLKGKTNVSPQIDIAISAAPDSQKNTQANLAGQLTRAYNTTRERAPRGVSPATLRAAKEKVRKWQASMTTEQWRDMTSGSSTSASVSAAVAATAAKAKIEIPQRSRTLDFAVVKPAAKSINDKTGKGSLSRLGPRGCSAPILRRKSKSSTPSRVANVSEVRERLNVDETDSKQPPKTSPVKDDMPKITDVPETPYVPPSFPAHLETSTPLPDSEVVIRAKPSPILPLPPSSSMPLPSTSADPRGECQFIMAVDLHAANVSSSLPPRPPQINTVQPGKRSRASSPSLDSIPRDPRVTPPAKRLRTLSQNGSTPSFERRRPMSPNGGLGVVPCVQDEERDPSTGAAQSHRETVATAGMMSGAPSTQDKNEEPPTGVDAQGFPEKVPSPTKSVKSVRSYFSAPDSDPADSPLKANLLLESPVSPMFSYVQNPSGFLPQYTSTQAERGSPSAGRTNHGTFGMGYSSQFDVERHVDRVSEMLERDVDFDGWLRDVRTVETSQD